MESRNDQGVNPGGAEDLSQASPVELLRREFDLLNQLNRIHEETRRRLNQSLVSGEINKLTNISIPASAYGSLVKRYILELAGMEAEDRRIITTAYDYNLKSQLHRIVLTWEADLTTKAIDIVILTCPSRFEKCFDVEIRSKSCGEGTAMPDVCLWTNSSSTPAIQRGPQELLQQARSLGLGLLNLPLESQKNLLIDELLELLQGKDNPNP